MLWKIRHTPLLASKTALEIAELETVLFLCRMSSNSRSEMTGEGMREGEVSLLMSLSDNSCWSLMYVSDMDVFVDECEDTCTPCTGSE